MSFSESLVSCTSGQQCITILYHLHQCRPCILQVIHVNVFKGGISILQYMYLELTCQHNGKQLVQGFVGYVLSFIYS